ncbi:hypothetical protein AbraIFM66950_006463 [Aspergillus brasiliensis]|nr:hypothetical protein AbraIFM66950_006463 [Aspergillus brasiliensis]
MCPGLRIGPGMALQDFINEPEVEAPLEVHQILAMDQIYDEGNLYQKSFHLCNRPGEPSVKTFILQIGEGQGTGLTSAKTLDSHELARLTCYLSEVPIHERAIQPAARGGVYSHLYIRVTARFLIKGYLEFKIRTASRVLAAVQVPRIWSERAGN